MSIRTKIAAAGLGGRGGVLAGSVVDHLASQGALTYDSERQLLYAVNAGSNTVTVVAVHDDRLQRLAVVGLHRRTRRCIRPAWMSPGLAVRAKLCGSARCGGKYEERPLGRNPSGRPRCDRRQRDAVFLWQQPPGAGVSVTVADGFADAVVRADPRSGDLGSDDVRGESVHSLAVVGHESRIAKPVDGRNVSCRAHDSFGLASTGDGAAER